VIAGGRLVALGAPDSIGGRDADVTRIRFVLPGGALLADLPLPARAEEGSVVIETGDATAALHALTSWAIGRGVALPQLTVTRRTLEDVYLDLVGQ
jgi:ABC-2 type transport system ATP-binding protein